MIWEVNVINERFQWGKSVVGKGLNKRHCGKGLNIRHYGEVVDITSLWERGEYTSLGKGLIIVGKG